MRRRVDCFVLVGISACLTLGCGRAIPQPSPLPEIVAPEDGAAELLSSLEALQSSDPKRRALAVSELASLGEAGESVLSYVLAALEDPNHLVRVRAVQALGTLGDPSSINPLIDRLKDKGEDRDVRARAAEALGKLQAVEAVEPLVVAMDDMFWHIRYHAMVALGRIGDRRAEGVLQRAAEYDPDFQNREVAQKILAEWNSEAPTDGD